MPRVIHFDIHADNPERAVKFYQQAFGWKTEKWNGPGMDYWMVSTGDANEPGIDGGISRRSEPNMPTYNTIGVVSLDQSMDDVVRSGGKILSPKGPIPGVGYFALCADTEGNPFGIMQPDRNAK